MEINKYHLYNDQEKNNIIYKYDLHGHFHMDNLDEWNDDYFYQNKIKSYKVYQKDLDKNENKPKLHSLEHDDNQIERDPLYLNKEKDDILHLELVLFCR